MATTKSQMDAKSIVAGEFAAANLSNIQCNPLWLCASVADPAFGLSSHSPLFTRSDPARVEVPLAPSEVEGSD